MAVAEAGGRKLCVARFGNDYHAFAFKCPHAGGIMANGRIDPSGNVVCPLHRYRFSIVNGRNTSGEGYHLRVYPLRIDEYGIHAGIEEGGLFT
jgi:3-phenylpropionate/trans-cinnamate dioxygenase ferredoxin subunit